MYSHPVIPHTTPTHHVSTCQSRCQSGTQRKKYDDSGALGTKLVGSFLYWSLILAMTRVLNPHTRPFEKVLNRRATSFRNSQPKNQTGKTAKMTKMLAVSVTRQQILDFSSDDTNEQLSFALLAHTHTRAYVYTEKGLSARET